MTAPTARRSRAAALALAACIALGLAAPARAADEPAVERVQVAAPFIDLRTGPGRGYPIQTVAPRDEWITIELRHTDWFKVRTAAGKVGWVDREQLESTLTADGGKKTLRDVLVDDYLRRRLDFGAAWGMFSSEPMLKLWTGYRFSDTLSVEATLAQVQGQY
nr:SH3 domain-containing protein [Piscinibacter sp.]